MDLDASALLAYVLDEPGQVDGEIAVRACLMIVLTRSAGLSLGDRCCLAAAQVAGSSVLTADRAWLSVSKAHGVRVEMIR